jgi:hypothetical protein
MRYPALHRYLRRTYEEEANRRGAPGRAIETSISETLPLRGRPSTLEGPPRLNLLVPAVSIRHVFGGISTALQVFHSLIDGNPDARIILTDEQSFSPAENPAMAAWQVATLEDTDRPGRIILAAGTRYGRSLPVSSRDFFMATAWWTAALGRGLRDCQAQAFGFERRLPFVYFIQDYEPGFYPWSSRYALADATYRQEDDIVAVFNTSLLKAYFLDEGYGFQDALVLEPGLNPGLRKELDGALPMARERRVLVYGRPGVDRNAFSLIVEGLRLWCSANPGNRWEFLSVGESHPDIPLAQGQSLVSLGKLSLAAYGGQMRKARVGISLMISPHPSYPPLEMAAFGLTVVTNGYKRKDLSRVCSRIMTVDPLNAAGLAQALDRALASHCAPGSDLSDATGFFRKYLDGGSDLSRLGPEIVDRLLRPVAAAVRAP